MSTVAIIPARGGSKGIKDKNLQEVGGVSLVGRAIRSAKMAQKIQEVYVSTDSRAIAAEARRWGAKTLSRPADISADDSSSESALEHAVNEIDGVDIVVFLQCTSPFIRGTELDLAVEWVESGKYDSVFSAIEDHGFRWQEKGGVVEPVGHRIDKRSRRQDLPNRYLETGAFYTFRAEGLLKAGSRFHGLVGCVPVTKISHIDIDDQDDLERARLISKIFFDEPLRKKIRGVVLDFDGVQTDDYVWLDQDGREMVRVSRSDGHGISLMKQAGLDVLILSTEKNSVVSARARKLGVEVILGQERKAKALVEWAKKKKLNLEELAFLGNETNDLDAMKLVGLPVAVSDANPEIIRMASVVLTSKGGEKAVRELAGIVEGLGVRGENANV